MESDRIAALLAPFIGNALSDAQLSQLAPYLDLLVRWNARMNLTAIRDPDQMVTRHFGESLFAAQRLYSEPGTRNSQLVDIGSGAGFPGLPLKIWAPELRVILLESNQKKATFLREAVRTLGLNDVQVLTDRAERFAAQITNYKLRITNSLTVTLRAVERFEQIFPTAVRLLDNMTAAERRLALLIGAAQVRTAHKIAANMSWSEPLPIPQSTNRVLLIGKAPGCS